MGDTTYFGAAGGGTVNTSNGLSAAGAGQATGSVTQTQTGANYNTQASGSVAMESNRDGI